MFFGKAFGAWRMAGTICLLTRLQIYNASVPSVHRSLTYWDEGAQSFLPRKGWQLLAWDLLATLYEAIKR
jgi:hypothetical protein